MAKLFLAKGALIDVKSKTQGWTPLHLAAQRNSVYVADLLVVRGADVNATDIRGNTALHYAALNGFLAFTEVLLNGADEETDGDGVSGDFPPPEVTHPSPLPSLNAVNVKGNSPLHVLASRGGVGGADSVDQGDRQDAEEDVIKIAKLLVGKGADLKILNRQNRTPYDMAELASLKRVLNVEYDGENRKDAANQDLDGDGGDRVGEDRSQECAELSRDSTGYAELLDGLVETRQDDAPHISSDSSPRQSAVSDDDAVISLPSLADERDSIKNNENLTKSRLPSVFSDVVDESQVAVEIANAIDTVVI